MAGITDELRTKRSKNVWKTKFQKILEKSTDIRSESYWHQINPLIAWQLVTKDQVQTKYSLGGSRNYGQITDETEQKCVEKNFNKF